MTTLLPSSLMCKRAREVPAIMQLESDLRQVLSKPFFEDFAKIGLASQYPPPTIHSTQYLPMVMWHLFQEDYFQGYVIVSAAYAPPSHTAPLP